MEDESNTSEYRNGGASENDSILEETNTEMDQEIVTMSEVIQNEQNLMDDANAVLGAIDDKKCTYSEGYMIRQALYSCLTCIPEAKEDLSKSAGVCLACVYNCHEGHDLIELYTKRQFRCDCGNQKFIHGQTCNLNAIKSPTNEHNVYNHNFSGLYCTCSRPYPDPEDTVNDEMIQCIICEDWYHTRHLNVQGNIPVYAEMICETCVGKHDFLLHYDGLCIKKVAFDESTKTVDVDATSSDSLNKQDGTLDIGEAAESSTESQETQICKKPKQKTGDVSTKFWADVSWRKQLCVCKDCLQVYKDQRVLFLIDPQDTVQCYEEKGKAKTEEFQAKQEEDRIKYLNSLNRVPLLEALASYDELKVHLKEYLKKFAENRKIVREEDIKEFFEGFEAKKKQKCDTFSNCR